mmetsp:Transcript_54456/g.80840  ORF Transcript_54456/g.80840 Transcript_54456/m.80840 type:complete len:306 (+) Transcript_54456:290-1207(+)|eukprot:CAMPEP_0195530252 /NCGR_PEP_ID=MMETSP0794_2-20130614/33089_1 /TAXON_ID=515487 /ORGANISM="Stephanopyxis turris, Strain CCMP 815" /LENGTH=305 /DNA_ID=CAMNT_0040661723 /DNA_START=286 /DNA_END=1203 /DNA_ORIENTATION=+
MTTVKNKDENFTTSLKKSLKALDVQKKSLETEADAIISELSAPGPNGEEPMGIHTDLVDCDGYPRSDIDIFRARSLRHRLAEIKTDHKDMEKRIEDGLLMLPTLSNSSIRKEEEVKARMAPKPKPKFDPSTGKWVVKNWDGTVAGIEQGDKQSFDKIGITNEPPATMAAAVTSTTTMSVDENTRELGETAPSPPQKEVQIPFATVNAVATDSPAMAAGLMEGDLLVKFGSVKHNNHNKLQKIGELVPKAAADHEAIEISVLRKSIEGVGDESQVEHSLKILPKPWGGRGLLGCHIVPYTNHTMMK